jgi:hypothetical protein
VLCRAITSAHFALRQPGRAFFAPSASSVIKKSPAGALFAASSTPHRSWRSKSNWEKPNMKSRVAMAGAIAAALLIETVMPLQTGGFVTRALAVVGHPLTPVSVAGASRRTARRTTRRVEYRQSIAGCSPYRSYYNCGGIYYAPTVQNGTTVYVVVNP